MRKKVLVFELIWKARSKYSSLLTTAKTHEEMAARAARRDNSGPRNFDYFVEVEQLRGQNAEMRRKTQVEIESLHEQLRVRKEKQYHLLEKMQAAEEAKRQAEDQVTAMEEKLCFTCSYCRVGNPVAS